MKISQITLKNCLGIKELEITPGKITILEGKEGEGKTSVLESIQRFFYNKSERSTFVNTDASKSETYLMFDDGTTAKKYVNQKGQTTTATVEKNGTSPKNVEMFLKGLVSEKQLNPISLISMKDKELSDLILSLISITITEEDLKEWLNINILPTGINLNQHGLKVCKDIEELYYSLRTDINRDIKNTTAEINDSMSKLPDNYDADEWRNVALQDKYEKIKLANELNSTIERAKAAIENNAVEIKSLETERDLKIENLLQEIEKIKEAYSKRIELQNKKCVSATEYIKTHNNIDITPLELDLKHTEDMKSYVRIADELQEKKLKFNELTNKSENYSKIIEFIRVKPQQLLSNAEMPIQGLSVDQNGNVLVNERPIINLSGGERIKFVMNIVRALAGELKIILIDGFEKLSKSGQNEFINECQNDEFQYIITKVTDNNFRAVNIDNHVN